MFYVIGQQILTGADGGFKDRLLQVLDTSDGVAEWHSYAEVVSLIKKQNIAVFGIKPLKVYHPTSGVFNSHVASILLGRSLRFLGGIKDFNIDTLGFATETLSDGEYGFDNVYYDGVLYSGVISSNMDSIRIKMQVESTARLQSIDLPKCVTIIDEKTIYLDISSDTILHLNIGEPTDDCRALAKIKYIIKDNV